MKSFTLIAGAMIVSALLLGCGNGDVETPLATRLESALEIQEAARKDANLRQIAIDAANANDKEICKKAIEGMKDSTTGDDTAADCLRSFRKAGDVDAAVEMAKLIKNESRRDMFLSDLSQ